MVYTAYYSSPIGRLLLAEREEALIGLWIEGQKYFPDLTGQEWTERPESVLLRRTKTWLDRYFSGEKPPAAELPLSPEGSGFRRTVWKALCEIPYGRVVTYGEIARNLSRTSARAVGGAVGHNPISIVILCHRVIGAGGKLTGYAGGVERKRWLLEHEGACVAFPDAAAPLGGRP